jgi:SAM-dependent methyltransferase
MSPKVFVAFADILGKRFRPSPGCSVLEIGASAWTVLAIPLLQHARKIALNLRFNDVSALSQQAQLILGNSNALGFPNETFDCVISCSALEHDPYFWRTVAETRRVLKKGGVFVVGVPIYRTLPTDYRRTTLTYARHGVAYNADFYRFSEQAVREIFFEGYAAVTDEVLVRRYPNPYLVAAGRK